MLLTTNKKYNLAVKNKVDTRALPLKCLVFPQLHPGKI